MNYKDKVFGIEVTHGLVDDPDEEYMLKDIFIDDVDAQIFYEKLAQEYIEVTGWNDDAVFEKVWYGHQLKVRKIDNYWNRKIDCVTYSIQELNLHK